jgi:2-methylcitrate dehydratase PrpD
MSTPATRISEFATGLEQAGIPPAVLAAARLHILDTIGCGLAAHALGVGGEGLGLAVEQGWRPESTVIGHRGLLPAPSAALANGMLCHRLDYDDTHTGSATHVSVTVVPAAIAAAEAARASGLELLVATVVGSEIAIRIALAAPLAFHHRGFHPTSVCGVFGATAAAARLQRLQPSAFTNAMGITGSMASGLFEYLADGSATKPLHPGWAAQAAIQAVRLAERGSTGPATVLEGRFGLYSAFLGMKETALAQQLEDLGERWETPSTAFKPYPACHFSHASLDSVRELMTSEGIGAADVSEAVATVPADAVDFVLEPSSAKRRPRSDYEAKFSLQFSIAAMLIDGRVGVDTYTPKRIADPQTLALAGRVGYQVLDFPSYPAAFPGGVRITTVDGRRLEAQVPFQRGGQANPMADGDVREKFVANASLALSEEDVIALESAILTLDEGTDLQAALAPLGRAAAIADLNAVGL